VGARDGRVEHLIKYAEVLMTASMSKEGLKAAVFLLGFLPSGNAQTRPRTSAMPRNALSVVTVSR
jgi:hypothetical protein